MDELFLKVFSDVQENVGEVTLKCPLETVVSIFVIQYCGGPAVTINLVYITDDTIDTAIDITLNCRLFKVYTNSNLPTLAKGCILPVIITNGNTVIAGLCAVARQIVKATLRVDANKFVNNLLGFRDACLMSPNETSVWTKFCEIDIIETIKDILKSNISSSILYAIPKHVARFEIHMSQPIRIHNVYKIAQDAEKMRNDKEKISIKNEPEYILLQNLDLGHADTKNRAPKNRKFKSKPRVDGITSLTPRTDLKVEHIFAEGPFLTLADIILYPCFHIIINKMGSPDLCNFLPLCLKWIDNVTNAHDERVKGIIGFINIYKNEQVLNYSLPNVENYSMYKSDPKRYKPKNRIFTKQDDIIKSLNIVSLINFKVKRMDFPSGYELAFDWLSLPFEALPEGGALPEKRLKRKTEQLENLVKTVLAIAKPGDRIVDFCSGSGHLGIILAVKLPSCNIVLLENKEESLNRAKIRVHNLAITNVTFLQCNLDFFKGDFEIGVSLHACGVATDLVIRICIDRAASFVCCPCCYGSIHDCHHLTYPRSGQFIGAIAIRDYLVIAHSADQTHDEENVKTKQGEHCMDVIDSDRALHAMESGYDVTLTKLWPKTCTAKNNLLVGISGNANLCM